VQPRDALAADTAPVGMSPTASNGPPHSRSTSVHVGGPVRTSNGEKLNGMNDMAGDSRIFLHYDDLKRVRPKADRNSPIRTIIQEAEQCAKQADTQLDFRRPDRALQEHIRASILIVDILPNNKDNPTLLGGTGELRRTYLEVQKRLQAQHTKIQEAVEIIKENNKRSGVKPAENQKPSNELPGDNGNGHVRAQSAQGSIMAGSPRHIINGHQAGGRSIEGSRISVPTPTSAVASPARKKPPIHPKPDALHGRALQATNSSLSPRSPALDLETRFAHLRGNTGSPMQDSRIQTRPITNPDARQTSAQSLIAARNTTLRPAGPREMPAAPTSVLRPTKISVDVPMSAMPRPPDAIYSPERITDSLTGLDLPSSAPRGSPYLGSKGQTSAPPISTVGPSPSSAIPRSDYFTTFSGAETPGFSQTQAKRQNFVLPDTTTVTTEELMTYIGMGLQGFRLLLVDLRNRDEFDSGHIMAQSIICVEPIGLRDGMSADELGESIVLSPDTEQELYEQRQEFDLVVFYDQSSSSMEPNNQAHENPHYLQDFSKAIFDYGYSKQVQRRPMLLLGGLDAWVDKVGPNALKTSSTSTTLARQALRPARPLGRVPMARDTPRLQALARRPRESRPLSKEEELKWAETLREDTDTRIADGEAPDFEEFSYIRTTEDFVRRYPELPSVQESMVSTPASLPVDTHHSDVVSSVPRPPTRPAPALPRQRSSGISERGPSATYAMVSGTGPSTISSTPIPHGLTGLDTTGTTCYVNAVLQCLGATKGFRDFLIHFKYDPPQIPLPPRKGTETSDPPQLLTRHLTKVYMSLWCGQYEWITPKTLWVCI
jgi:ubiquitin carboxyl-terminal hydrolase 8